TEYVERRFVVAGAPHAEELAVDEVLEARRRIDAAEERGHAVRAKGLAEDAASAKNTTVFRAELREPRIHHREHGFGQVRIVAVGYRAKELLEIKGVALRTLHDARDHARVGTLAEHLARESFGTPSPEAAELHAVAAARRKQVRERALNFGACE